MVYFQYFYWHSQYWRDEDIDYTAVVVEDVVDEEDNEEEEDSAVVVDEDEEVDEDDSYQDDGDTRQGAEAWHEGHHQYYSLGLFVKDGAADSAGIDEDAEEEEEDAVDIVVLK
mmetsp:Transcript_51950/g.56275  ORF Transcript_51950/g.56275 Transcript_51950/m.56275 type:complete len:113 (-) Transcript_51950:62-400(-)